MGNTKRKRELLVGTRVSMGKGRRGPLVDEGSLKNANDCRGGRRGTSGATDNVAIGLRKQKVFQGFWMGIFTATLYTFF